MSRKKVSGRMIAKRNRRYNKIAMIGITLVVCMMLVLLYVEGRSVQQRISANTQKQQERKRSKRCRIIYKATNIRRKLQKKKSVS